MATEFRQKEVNSKTKNDWWEKNRENEGNPLKKLERNQKTTKYYNRGQIKIKGRALLCMKQ